MIQAWNSTSVEDFHSAFYKENIVTAKFLDSNAVPSNAVERWDVSVDKDGGVMAYVTESTLETGKYDLYIGVRDGVIANENSNHLFFCFTRIEKINFGYNYDTSNVVNMEGMFGDTPKIVELDLSSFDTSNVTTMNQMFINCSGLEKLNL